MARLFVLGRFPHAVCGCAIGLQPGVADLCRGAQVTEGQGGARGVSNEQAS